MTSPAANRLNIASSIKRRTSRGVGKVVARRRRQRHLFPPHHTCTRSSGGVGGGDGQQQSTTHSSHLTLERQDVFNAFSCQLIAANQQILSGHLHLSIHL